MFFTYINYISLLCVHYVSVFTKVFVNNIICFLVFLAAFVQINVKLFFSSSTNVYLCIMEICIEVKSTSQILYSTGLTCIPRIGEKLVYEYTDSYIVVDVIYHCGFSIFEVQVIVEKL